MTRPAPTFPRRRGAILLEVVLSLSLFVLAAALILSALRASHDAATFVRQDIHGENLAMSILSELEMGQIDLASLDDSPLAFSDDEDDPFVDWSWEISSEDLDASSELPPEQQLTIIIRSPNGRVAMRLVTLWPAQDEGELEEVDEDGAAPDDPAKGGAL
ncbi:MAG: hypothetical protein HN909_03685 [Phycisphaerales bacterium]|jgi:hypothetical protein|nr:hypothetical protein [Phycisphaerales bacterium]MBT7170853.1 hypothetical protein [Phycisphaerales bacterium]